MELLATVIAVPGEQLGRAGSSPVLTVSFTDPREAALGSCIKLGIDRSCQ